MLKFIGAQVYQHQDNVIVEMGVPAVESHNPSPITPPTSNLNIVENDGLIELITQPNSTIRIQHGNSGWSFTANEQGRTNIGRLENGVYRVSVNNSEPEPVVLAKSEQYQWMRYQYYAPDNYIIRVNTSHIPGTSDRRVVLYDAEGNELYSTTVNWNINDVDITYTMEDSPGLLEPGEYWVDVNTWVQYFTLEPGNSLDILSLWYNNYLSYNIKIGAPRGSQVYLQGPDIQVYDIDESLSINLISEGWGPDLLEGSYTIFYIFDEIASNIVNLDLVGRPFQDVRIDYLWYDHAYNYVIYLLGEPFSRVVVGGVEYPYPISADGQLDVSSLHLYLGIHPGEVYDIYTYNRDWKSNTMHIMV